MEPFYQDSHRTLYNKDCRSMSELPDESVQMVVTSPPYWGLRKYAGNQDLIWGGDNHCQHEWVTKDYLMHSGRGDAQKSGKYSTQEPIPDMPHSDNTCSLCGAWRGAYGLEPTPELYVQHTIEVLREIRRVLRKDGVVFWNIGDSYQGGNRGASAESDIKRGDQGGSFQPHNIGAKGVVSPSRLSHHTIKPKDLCLIPFRVAIAAQEDGWWVRSVIIWNKNNPMPESVTDRPTESHEYILMLTKSARYYWDAEAVREKYTKPMNRWGGDTLKRDTSKTAEYKEMQNIGYSSAFRVGRPMRPDPSGRNLRSVWSFPTMPYPGAHFATFPEKLPELCIKAATPEVGSCAKCGAPWVRIVEKTGHINKREPAYCPNNCETKTDSTGWAPLTIGTNQWKQSCACNTIKPPVPSIVLDPFAGSGTVLLVAAQLGRHSVGYELSEEYCRLIVERNKQQVLV